MNDQLPFTRESQNETIKQWLLAGHTLTTLEAFNRWKITRLSRRIFDIRNSGINVQSRWIETSGGARVKAYYVDPWEQFISSNSHKKPTLRERAKQYVESLPEDQRLDAQLALSGFIVWNERERT